MWRQKLSRKPNRQEANQHEEYPSSSTKSVAYKSIPIRGEEPSIAIKIEDFVMHRRTLLNITSSIDRSPALVCFDRIIIMWYPLIEPGHLSSISIKVSYDIAEDTTIPEQDNSVVSLIGKISEYHKITLYPTRPIMYTKGDKADMPWRVSVTIPGTLDNGQSHILGNLKIWGPLKTDPMITTDHTQPQAYKDPTVDWSNLHHPYYIPFYTIKSIRGVEPIRWKKTKQYRNFEKDVMLHIDPITEEQGGYLGLMQTLSQSDHIQIHERTKSCHITKGGSNCTCKSDVTDFIAECINNRRPGYDKHQEIYERLETGIRSGVSKTTNNLISPIF